MRLDAGERRILEAGHKDVRDRGRVGRAGAGHRRILRRQHRRREGLREAERHLRARRSASPLRSQSQGIYRKGGVGRALPVRYPAAARHRPSLRSG